jgi:hypothetical protein
MRKFANLFIMVWIHMDAHEYVFFFFEKLNILCIFRNRFFDPVLFRFFSGSGFWGRPVR